MSTFMQGDWPYYPRRTSDGPAFVPVLTPKEKTMSESDPRNIPGYDRAQREWENKEPPEYACPDDGEDDSPYCRCDNLPTLGERDRNKCDSCGKVLK